MDSKIKLLDLALAFLQILSLAGGQVLWKKGIDQAGGFMSNGQSVFTSLFHLAITPAFLLGSVLYIVATLLWFYLLARFELSYIYPFMSLTFVVSFLGAWLFLGETISLQRWLALGFISFGIFFLVQT